MKDLSEKLKHLETVSSSIGEHKAKLELAIARAQEFDAETNEINRKRQERRQHLAQAQHAAGEKVREAEDAAEQLATLRKLIGPVASNPPIADSPSK